jgi:hypothetical protein
MTARTNAGLHPPKFVIGRVISQIQAFLAPEIAKHPIYQLLETKLTSAPLNFDTTRTAKTLAALLVGYSFMCVIWHDTHGDL